MKKFSYLILGVAMAAGMSFAASPKSSSSGAGSYVGSISDSMCGAKHMMPGKSDKECTVECVKGGSKYVLVDSNGKIYQLSDQTKPTKYAGEKVKVAGKLQGDTIVVTSITPAQ